MRTPTSRSRLWLTLVTLAGAAAVVGVLIASASGSSSSPPLAPAHLSHQLLGPPPWRRNVTGLRARLDALGLPALAQEGTTLHIHQHLDLYVDGRRVTVPAGIGIDESEGFISPLHTHDESGVIHVESPDVRTFRLGQFFAVWGVRLTSRCLGGDCATGSKLLRVFVDGKRYTGDPRLLPLAEHEEILVAYGTRTQLPRPIPARFEFAPGLYAGDTMRCGQDDVGLDERAATAVTARRLGQAQRHHEPVGADGGVIAAVDGAGRRRRRRRDQDRHRGAGQWECKTTMKGEGSGHVTAWNDSPAAR